MPLGVQLTDDAASGLKEIYRYIDQHDAPLSADHVLDQIEEALANLAKFPRRGNHPQDLLEIGIREYREIFVRPYRIIYRSTSEDVYVLVIADGRRDMQMLLQRRLLRA